MLSVYLSSVGTAMWREPCRSWPTTIAVDLLPPFAWPHVSILLPSVKVPTLLLTTNGSVWCMVEVPPITVSALKLRSRLPAGRAWWPFGLARFLRLHLLLQQTEGMLGKATRTSAVS